MVRIPFQLQDARYRFVRLKMHSKKVFPVETWITRWNHWWRIQNNHQRKKIIEGGA